MKLMYLCLILSCCPEHCYKDTPLFCYNKIKNEFFGEKITVTGLLCGCDIINQLSGKDYKKRLVICDVMIKDGTELFLDDTTITDIENKNIDLVITKDTSRLGRDHIEFGYYVEKFGFTMKTGIDLNGESSGIIFDRSRVGPVELATMGYGQSISVTPIQLLTAVQFFILINPGFELSEKPCNLLLNAIQFSMITSLSILLPPNLKPIPSPLGVLYVIVVVPSGFSSSKVPPS